LCGAPADADDWASAVTDELIPSKLAVPAVALAMKLRREILFVIL
jgi:hypothetical protein